MTEFSWADLCDSADEDDEDYDPFNDPSSGCMLGDDSDSDSFEALRHLLSPKPKRRKPDERADDGGGATSDASPAVQAHWHTRTQGKLPDDVWTRTDSLLEKAEMALDPLSPGAQSDTHQNEMLDNITNPEYIRLLAVARGEREPDDDDDDDADFEPPEEEEEEGGVTGDADDASAAKLSVTQEEVNALLADNGVCNVSSSRSPRSPRVGCAGTGRPAQQQVGGKRKATSAGADAKPRRSRGEQGLTSQRAISVGDPIVRVLPFADAGVGGGLMTGVTPGFSKDQCLQLHDQMRLYFQVGPVKKEGQSELCDCQRGLIPNT